MKKILKALKILKFALCEPENLILRIIEEEAKDYLKGFTGIRVKNTEDFEDLLYHINSYMELPETVKYTMYDNKIFDTVSYIEDLEKLRAVEREYIFELAKRLPIGFNL